MIHLLYDPLTLKSISGHYSTEDTIPDTKIQAIQNSRTHLAGYGLCEELYLSKLDLEMHKTKDFWLDIIKRLYKEHFVFELDKRDAHPCSFTQVTSGEWGAAYFSHLHSRLIAADVYSAFEEAKKSGQDEFVQVGKRYRDTFLALGGSCNPAEVFRRFRGRDPSTKALLKTIKSSK